MLFGRQVECARVDALLLAAWERRSGSLVVRGEAGIGKSALLEYAIERAAGFRVLRALGVGSEAELVLAGVQQLVHPLLSRLAELRRCRLARYERHSHSRMARYLIGSLCRSRR
jgi:hypothetical protein